MLVACAALGTYPTFEMEDADRRYVIDTNLSAYLACAKHAIARMEANGGDQITNKGPPTAGQHRSLGSRRTSGNDKMNRWLKLGSRIGFE